VRRTRPLRPIWERDSDDPSSASSVLPEPGPRAPARDLSLIPMITRPRFHWGNSPTIPVPPTTVSTTHTFGDVLPPGWEERFWCLAELRGYRANTTAIVSAVLVLSAKAEGVPLYVQGTSNNSEGFALEAQAGPLPCYWPLPRNWKGSIDFVLVGDSAATMPFRFQCAVIELTGDEWRAMWGRDA